MRRRLFLPVAALVVFAGYLGLRLGQPMGDTDIINTYAAQYLHRAGAGAKPSDCHASPGAGAVRLVITCTPSNGPTFVFRVGPRGALIGGTDITGPKT